MSFRSIASVPAIATSILVLVTAGCATHTQKSAGEAVDDTVLVATVKTKLIGAKEVSANDINVEVYKGQVQLAGFVDSEQAKQAAIDVARSVSGVSGVSDAMVVFTESRTAGEVFEDGLLASKVKTAATQAAGTSKALDMNVEVRKGNVILSGFIPTEEAKARVGDAASAVLGVRTVYNNIEVVR